MMVEGNTFSKSPSFWVSMLVLEPKKLEMFLHFNGVFSGSILVLGSVLLSLIRDACFGVDCYAEKLMRKKENKK